MSRSPQVRKQTKMWKSTDGRKRRICDMTDEHLANAIRCLEKAHGQAILSAPPMVSGEMAEYYIMRDWDSLVNSSVEDLFPIYRNLKEEETRRKALPKKIGVQEW